MSDAGGQLDDWANPPQWWSTAITDTGDFFYHLSDGWEAARPFAPVATITLIFALDRRVSVLGPAAGPFGRRSSDAVRSGSRLPSQPAT